MRHAAKDGGRAVISHGKYADSDRDDASSLGGGECGLDLASAHTMESNIRDDIAGKFTSLVTRSGSAVTFMLFLTATLVVSSTYVFLTRTKVAEFEKAFEQSARTITDAAQFTARSNIQTLNTLADSITSEAMTVGATWPFFTSENFEIKAAHARVNSFSEVILFMPYVRQRFHDEWEAYSVENQGWIAQSQRLYKERTSTWVKEAGQTVSIPEVPGEARKLPETAGGPTANQAEPLTNQHNISPRIFSKAEDLAGGKQGDITIVEDTAPRLFYAPVWQVSPPPFESSIINYNILGDSASARLSNAIEASGGKVVVSELLRTSTIDFLYKGIFTNEGHSIYHASSQNEGSDGQLSPDKFPHSLTMAPVYASFDVDRSDMDNLVGYVAGIGLWDFYLSNLLPEGVNGVYAVLSNSCAQTVTYSINGPVATYRGEGDLHDTSFDSLKESLVFEGFGNSAEAVRRIGQCDYILNLYPSSEFRNEYDNTRAIVFTVILGAVFVATGIIFLVFVVLVQQRQNKVVATATKTNAIVESLFPGTVRDRIMKDVEAQANRDADLVTGLGKYGKRNGKKDDEPEQRSLENDVNLVYGSKPIAALVEVLLGGVILTLLVMLLCDVGFTAWSSMREPQQVFMLLVAAAGLPEPRRDHAVAMARFARDCNAMMAPLVKRLEVDLGPDTGDLALRTGLHSGPVTAGVLRGERARFQLFGDTMNTTARIESTGKAGRIHLSQTTADILTESGKSHWVVARTDRVHAKGKGELQTFWLSTLDEEKDGSEGKSESATVSKPIEETTTGIDDKIARLINWNVDMSLRLLRQIAARRQTQNYAPSKRPILADRTGTAIDEVAEIITLPTFDAKAAEKEMHPEKVELSKEVEDELRDFVTTSKLKDM
eukprot:scaffold149_cov179-Amphora_coffeaeformis.AAC.8